MNKIGYYVHHHGDGHRQRALAIAQQNPEEYTLLGTNLRGRTENIDYVELCDDQGGDNNHKRNHLKATHYTPLHHQGIKKRMADIARWIAQINPSLLVVDVSVEIAMLARLCSTPTVYVRLAGNRLDEAHLEAFRSAEALLCPFHQILESKKTPKWILKKSYYFPSLTVQNPQKQSLDHHLVMILGKGGHEITIEQIIDMAQQLPNWHIDLLGPLNSTKTLPRNLKILGWVEDIESYITKASIVIGSAGDGLLAQISAAGKPYICLPQTRPFYEQTAKAKQLKKLDAAVICKKWPKNWKKIIKKALQQGPLMKFLYDETSLINVHQLLNDIAYKKNLSSCHTSPFFRL